jgi:hypothetical protein
MFAPAQMLDPLRIVHGTRNARYDCPDLAALDRHISRLRRHMTDLGSRMPEVADGCRADIDRLLDRRWWLTLPVVSAATKPPVSAGRRADAA